MRGSYLYKAHTHRTHTIHATILNTYTNTCILTHTHRHIPLSLALLRLVDSIVLRRED